MRLLVLLLICAQVALPWGQRGHYAINRAAVQRLTDSGPVFLKAHEDWIAYWSVIPDTWRGAQDPYSKILEDPNHGWFQEQFSFLKTIPKSRYEFVLALNEQQKKTKDPLTNVRWTGTLPYAAMESFDHMRIAMRRYRLASDAPMKKMIELEIAGYMGRLGHYIADAAMPLHDSIHHDGWAGENPKGYTTDPRVHGRFESQFVDLIELSEKDFLADVKAPRRLEDPWRAILAHIAMSFSHVEDVYRLDKAGAYTEKDNAEARKLVYTLVTAASQLLRDLAHTAWLESENTPVRGPFDPAMNPISPKNPRYNPATGSAPPAF